MATTSAPNLTVSQLKAVCDQKGIVYPSKATKAQLWVLINGVESLVESALPVAKFKGEY